MQIIGNEQIRLEEEKKLNIGKAGDLPTEQMASGLAAHVRTAWERAKLEKTKFNTQMIANLLQKRGEYDVGKLADIKQLGSDLFMMITDVKCRTALAMLKEVYFQSGEKPFSIEPTPLPKLSPQAEKLAEVAFMSEMNKFMTQMAMQGQDPMVMQQVMMEALPKFKQQYKTIIMDISKEKSTMMEMKIEDQLFEGEFYKSLAECLADIVSLKAGFIKGPIYRKKKTLDISEGIDGRGEVRVEDETIPTWDAPSPFDIFPMPGATGINNGGLFERLFYRRTDLQDMIGLPGFDEVAIRDILRTFTDRGWHEWTWNEQERIEAEGRESAQYYMWDKIECLEYHDAVPGRLIIQWAGKTDDEAKEQEILGKLIDPDFDYNVQTWLIDKWILAVRINDNPLGLKPYYKASYVEEKGSFWGRGLPETIPDAQSLANSAIRALQNNVGLASGPQIAFNKEDLAPDQDASRIWPWKIWKFIKGTFSSQTEPFMQFYQASMHASELITVYDKAAKIADEHCGIMGVAHGDPNVGGAGNALANYEKILTPNGLVEISALKEGDLVVNSCGSFSKVIGVYPQGESDIFRLKFNNGEHIDCDMNHRWSVRTHNDRKFQTLTTEEILEKGLFRKTKIGHRNPTGWRPKWMLPIIDFIEFDPRRIKIDPYTMGVLIGDGDSRCRITSMDKEIFNEIPYSLGKSEYGNHGKAWTRTIKGIKRDYISYGLKCKSIDKFIPEDYLFNSGEIRLKLLKGLMDTDGCCSKQGEVFFSTSSYKLAKDFVMLVRSLGATVSSICEEKSSDFNIKGRRCTRQKNYRIVFNIPIEKIFRLERKQKRVRVKPRTHTYITGIEYIGRFPATCISVDSSDKLFICGNFIPTHNTASGLSMFMGQQNRGIREVALVVDTNIISPVVTAIYYENYNLEDAVEYIGDVKIKAKGSSWLMLREQQALRLNDFLRATANPIDAPLMGLEGRKYGLKEAAKNLHLEADKLIPDQNEMKTLPGMAPPPGEQQLDEAGNPIQGVANRMVPTGPQGG